MIFIDLVLVLLELAVHKYQVGTGTQPSLAYTLVHLYIEQNKMIERQREYSIKSIIAMTVRVESAHNVQISCYACMKIQAAWNRMERISTAQPKNVAIIVHKLLLLSNKLMNKCGFNWQRKWRVQEIREILFSGAFCIAIKCVCKAAVHTVHCTLYMMQCILC